MAVYAISDLHGRYDLYEQIKSFLNSEDTVYFLGDAGDRGPDGWKLIKAICENPQFVYLKGNHEDMLITAAQDYLRTGGSYTHNYNICRTNGGEKTFKGWRDEGEMRRAWIQMLEELPTHAEYINSDGIQVFLSHAGFMPIYTSSDELFYPDNLDLMWSRNHYYDSWDSVNLSNAISVHGHTPIPLMREEFTGIYSEDPMDLGAFWYCGDHKVCIDNGSVWTGIACLFDLDTFDEHMFLAR